MKTTFAAAADGIIILIRGRWSEYRAYLIAETEALTPRTRWLYVQSFGLPWLAVILVGGVLCFVLDSMFNLGELGRMIVLGPVGFAGLAGLLYSGWIVMYYGIRADIWPMKEARAKGSNPPVADIRNARSTDIEPA